jgi:hypothetical protein
MKEADFTAVVDFGGRKLSAEGGTGAIVVLLDADDDCPAQLGPRLLGQMANRWPAVRKSVVLPKCEFEAWFLAAAISLRGRRRIRHDAAPPPNPEAIRGAKGFLERELMEAGSTYSPTVDQPSFAALFSFAEARACPSFEKLCRDLDVVFA